MRILVWGGAGCIGSHTALELVRAGHEVIVADNLLTGHRSLRAIYGIVVERINENVSKWKMVVKTTSLSSPPHQVKKVIPFFKPLIKSSSISEKNTWDPIVGIPGIFLMPGSAQTE